MDLTDARQLDRIRSGDTDALTGWFEEHVDTLYAFVFHRVGSRADAAADVTQATLLEALRSLERFDPGRGTMQAWLRVLSRNKIRDHLRHDRRMMTMVDVWDGIDARLEELYRQMGAEPLPDEVLERSETRELVCATLASLPAQYRELLEAKYIRDQSLQVIAEARSATIDSVKGLLRRARAAFKETFIAIAEPETTP